MVLWPLVLGKQHQLSVREFLYLHPVHKNLEGGGVYNIQTRRRRLIQLETKYSSNRGWKNHFFFTSGQWEFAPTKKAQDPRVRRETNMLSKKGHHAPRLTPNEISRVNNILNWARRHDTSMLFEVLCTVPRLMEFVYLFTAHVAIKLIEEVARVQFNPGPLAANTRGATPRKDQVQAIGKGKSKQMDMGKGKMIKPEKPKKAALFPLQTGGVFKIHDKDPAPSAPAVTQFVQWEKKQTEAPPRVAKVLNLVDEEDDVEAGKPAEVTSVPVPKVPTQREESKVKVIEAHLMRKRTLKKAVDAAAPRVVPAAAVTMANFLANWRR